MDHSRIFVRGFSPKTENCRVGGERLLEANPVQVCGMRIGSLSQGAETHGFHCCPYSFTITVIAIGSRGLSVGSPVAVLPLTTHVDLLNLE